MQRLVSIKEFLLHCQNSNSNFLIFRASTSDIKKFKIRGINFTFEKLTIFGKTLWQNVKKTKCDVSITFQFCFFFVVSNKNQLKDAQKYKRIF